MAAVAAFIDEPTVLGEPLDAAVAPGVADAASVRDLLAEHNLALARTSEISESLKLLVEELADEVAALPSNASLRVDPYLVLAAQRALIGSLRALDLEDESAARREMRVRLEQMRQVYRDLAEGAPIYEDRPIKDVVRWVDSVVDVPQARLADVLAVSARTLQRWISHSDSAAPEGDDARRVRIVAAVVNQLRHALTGPGVVRWFEQPHPRLGGQRPVELLDDIEALGRLTGLAASTRSHTAA